MLSCATVVTASNAIMEDGSRFHTLDLMPSATYAEIIVLFLYRISESVSRISVLALALADMMHCTSTQDSTVPCAVRGCLLGNANCVECSCLYKESVIIVLISEFLFLLIFLRVTATQHNAQASPHSPAPTPCLDAHYTVDIKRHTSEMGYGVTLSE